MTLSELKLGQKAKIILIKSGKSSLRLMELGFVIGTQIELTAIAPTGDPLAFQVGASVVSLRKAEASLIQIEQTI